MIRASRLSFGLVLLTVVAAGYETASAQTLPWRGRYVNRQGLFHVERLRWGNGITDNGLGAIQVVAPILGQLGSEAIAAALKGVDSDNAGSKGLSADDQARWDRYALQQAEANELLRQTAELVNWKPTGSAVSVNTDPNPQPILNNTDYGTNPWKPRPQ